MKLRLIDSDAQDFHAPADVARELVKRNIAVEASEAPVAPDQKAFAAGFVEGYGTRVLEEGEKTPYQARHLAHGALKKLPKPYRIDVE